MEQGMKVVFLYGGSARFAGTSTFEWDGPALDGVHKFILFLAQDSEQPRQTLALQELKMYGFCDIELEEGRPISPESLNDPHMSPFRQHYEGAFAEGSSLVWYP